MYFNLIFLNGIIIIIILVIIAEMREASYIPKKGNLCEYILHIHIHPPFFYGS